MDFGIWCIFSTPLYLFVYVNLVHLLKAHKNTQTNMQHLLVQKTLAQKSAHQVQLRFLPQAVPRHVQVSTKQLRSSVRPTLECTNSNDLGPIDNAFLEEESQDRKFEGETVMGTWDIPKSCRRDGVGFEDCVPGEVWEPRCETGETISTHLHHCVYLSVFP